jgi:uncharacterized DUF497 family protein
LEQPGSERFEWDNAKRTSHIEKHRIDFIDAQVLFDGRPTTTAQSACEFEVRFLTTGIVDDDLITVVWTWRREAIRLISARRARGGEIRTYRALFS